jgi:DNA-binding transcriptional ArsR family regulator
MAAQDDVLAAVAKALSHPLRVAIIRDLRASAGPVSPSEYAESNGVPLGNVSYHCKALREAGVARIIKREPVRGAVENFHALDGTNAAACLAVIDAIDKLE